MVPRSLNIALQGFAHHHFFVVFAHKILVHQVGEFLEILVFRLQLVKIAQPSPVILNVATTASAASMRAEPQVVFFFIAYPPARALI